VDAGNATGIAEFIAERFLCQRPPLGAGNERQIPARPRRQSLGEYRQDRQRYRRIRFLRLEAGHAGAGTLSPRPRSIAAAQPGVEQHTKPYPLPRTERPTLLIGRNIVLVLGLEAFAPRARRGFDASRRILFDVSCLMRPTE